MATGTIQAQPRAFNILATFSGSITVPVINNGFAELYLSNATNLNNIKAKMIDGVSYLVYPGSPTSLGASAKAAVGTKTDTTFTKSTIGNCFIRVSSLTSVGYTLTDPSYVIVLIPT